MVVVNRMDARERPSSLVSAKEKESKILDTAHNAHCIKYVLLGSRFHGDAFGVVVKL